MKVDIGDWVVSKTKDGELIHGYIERLDERQGVATVFSVQSDNAEAVGKPIVVKERWVRKMPTYALEDAEAIRSLIDLALATRDEGWFRELSGMLSALAEAKDLKRAEAYSASASINRLGYPV